MGADRTKEALAKRVSLTPLYAINLPCDWIIVPSMRQTRLYFKGRDEPNL